MLGTTEDDIETDMAPPTSDASPVSSRGVFQFVQLSHPDDAALTRHKVRSHASRNPRARQERVAKHQREQLSKRSLIRSDQTLPKDAFKPRRHNALSEPTTEGFMFSSKHVPLQYPLAESWDDHCLPFVMNKSFFDMGKTVYNAIPFVITKARERSALSLVCNAVGSAYMANAIRSVDSATNRLRAYTTALVAINSAIRDPQQYKSDDTLLGVWLLSLYELLLGAQESTNSDVEYSGWDIHSRGMTELLRLRSAENFATRNGRNVFWIVFNTVQIQALLTGQQCPKESCMWICNVYRHCEPSEHAIVRASIFSFHCSQICSRIRRLVNTGDRDKLLSSSTSILRDIDEVEKATYPLSRERPITDCVIDPPLAPWTAPDRIDVRYVGVYTYQSNCRMRLSCDAVGLLRHASTAAACTPQQQIIFTQLQHRCVEEFQAVADKVLFVMAVTLDIDSLTLFDQLKGLRSVTNLSCIVGWPDAIRVLWPVVQWPLRLIATCPFSLDWQRDAANEILSSMNEQLGIMRSLGTLYLSGMRVP